MVVHFGAHKTGTTVIQSALRDNADTLATRGIGVIEPRHPVMSEIRLGAANRRLAAKGAVRDEPDTFVPLVATAERTGHPVVVVSHEALLGPQLPRPGYAEGVPMYGFAPGRFRTLRDTTTAPIRAVIYIRGQAGFLRSQYAQWLKKGIPLDFEAWLDTLDLEALSWRPVVEAAAEAFGRDQVVIKGFQLSAIGVERHVGEFFTEVVGTAAPTGELEIRNPNLSLSATGVRLARAVADVPLEIADRRVVAAFLASRFAMSEGREPFDPLAPVVKDRLAALYDAENEAILAEFGGPSDAGRPLR